MGSTEVHYHRDEFQRLGRRLSEIEHLLKTSRDSQVPLNENVNSIVSELNKLGKEVQKLVQERDNAESELNRKQHEFYLLSEVRKDLVHSVEKCHLLQEKCQLLQEITYDKKKEIKRLEEELKIKDHQLQSVQHKAKVMQSQLSQLQSELKDRHEKVKNLQEEKDKLIKSYNAEREKAKKLVQTVYTLTSDREEMKVQEFLGNFLGFILVLRGSSNALSTF